MNLATFKTTIVSSVLCLFIAAPCIGESTSETTTTQKTGGVKSLEKRLQRLEEAIGRDVEGDKWYDRLQISGLIAVEAFHQSVDFNDPAEEDTDESDIDLATVELVVDAKIAKHVDGHVMFKYEEDDLIGDEGFITLVGTEAFPAYLVAGKQYIPFGNYDSTFVTDPNTLILGETDEGAAVAGYRFGSGMVDLSVGAFNGEIDKAGKDNEINSSVAAVSVHPLEFLVAGVSYTSNLASSDSLQEVVVDTDGSGEPGPINDLVGGWSAFATVEFLERFKIIGEYVGALDGFESGGLYDPADKQKRKPTD